ncbi:MAG: DUF1127 domain-containing protein [Alphaproteobacteria bacterium]
MSPDFNNFGSKRSGGDLASLLGEAMLIPVVALGALTAPLTRLFGRAGSLATRAFARQSTTFALSRLDDAMLKDIGVQRHDIARLADETARTSNDNKVSVAA